MPFEMNHLQNSVQDSETHLGFLGLGWMSGVGQVLLFREFLSAFAGNEICFGLIMAFWLFWIALGAALASCGKRWHRFQGFRLFHILLLSQILVLPCQIAAARLLPVLLDVPLGQFASVRSMAHGIGWVLLPSGLLVGYAFPVGIRSLRSFGQRQGIGLAYGLEAMGSAGASLLFSYLFQGRVKALDVWSLSALLLLSARWVFLPRTRRRTFCLVFGWLLALCFSLWITRFADEALTRIVWQKQLPRVEFLSSKETPYQRLSVGCIDEQFLLLGNGSVLFEFPDPFRSAEAVHGTLHFHPRPKRVLYMGGDLPGLIGETLRYPNIDMVGVQMDPDLLRLQTEYMEEDSIKELSSARVNLVFMDPRRYLYMDKEPFDLILSSLPQPDTVSLNRFYTKEFFLVVRSRLCPEGLFALSVPGAENYYEGAVGERVALIWRTLRSVFPTVKALPGDSVLFLASASASGLSLDPQELWQRFESYKIETESFSPAHFIMALEPGRLEFLQRELAKRSQGPINTDRQPLSHVTNLAVWGMMSESLLPQVLESLGSISYAWLVALLCVPFLLWVGLARILRGSVGIRKIPIGYVIWTTGISSMGFYVGCLFLVQSSYGFVYKEVGFLLASFMSGLVAGSVLLFPVLSRRRKTRALLFVDTFFVPLWILLLLSSQALLGGGIQPWLGKTLVGILLLMKACLTGMEFPLAVTRLSSFRFIGQPECAEKTLDSADSMKQEGLAAGRAAGILDAADHSGAMVGALAVGLLLLPAFGIPSTCLILCALKTTSVLMLWMGQERNCI